MLRTSGRAVLALAILAAASPAAAAGRWEAREVGGARIAGYVEDGVLSRLFVICEPDSAQIAVVLPGLAGRLLEEVSYTVALTVDGTAFVLPMLAHPLADGRATRLRHDGDPAALRPLLDALGAGLRAEVATPLGRGAVPLAGSGRAIGALQDGCPRLAPSPQENARH